MEKLANLDKSVSSKSVSSSKSTKGSEGTSSAKWDDYTKQLRRPSNIKEKFNYYHSSCRNCIERTFGVWKARWSILADMPYFHIDTQREIVLATMAIHNYIRQKNILDKAFQLAEDENYEPTIEHVRGASDSVLTAEDGVGSKNAYWLGVRDSIAVEIANQS